MASRASSLNIEDNDKLHLDEFVHTIILGEKSSPAVSNEAPRVAAFLVDRVQRHRGTSYHC